MQEAEILEKFKKKGFNNLTLEDLAAIQQSTTWSSSFKQATNEDWAIYSDKAGERLSHSSFNVKWVSKSKTSYSNLFSAVTRGDVAKVLEFLKVSDLASCRKALDSNNKTALHIAAREGKAEIVKILVDKGWEVDVKDKNSTTPLHQACNMNHIEIVTYLVETGADPFTLDSLGRNALMYAVCGPGVESAELLLNSEQFSELVFSRDITGKTALHYAVYNPHSKQTEIFDLLLNKGLNVNITDKEGKTPLHHASESGKAKAIRYLIKHGADENAKDLSSKTPSEVAANNNIKKLLSLCNVSEKTVKAFSEKRLEMKEEVKIEPKAIYKERLMNFLTQVQEAGIVNKQHIKKPQIYTGNWMEGVLSPITLFNELSYSTPSEAVLKVFNILFPYLKPLPTVRESEVILDEFFGNTYSKGRNDVPIYVPDESQAKKVSLELEVYKKTLASLKESNDQKDKNLAKLDKDLKQKNLEIEKLKTSLFETQQKTEKKEPQEDLSGKVNDLKSKLARAEAKLKECFDINTRLTREIELRPKNDDVEELINKVQILEADNRNLRFKAGQIFLRFIETPEEPQVRPGQIYVQDLEKLKRLHASLKNKPPGLKERLIDVDFNQDGKISKDETSKVLTGLELPPQDIISILRLLGFRHGNGVIDIQYALNLLDNVEEKQAKLHSELFLRILKILNSNALGVEKAFEYLDVNRDGLVTFAEFSEGCEKLRINLNREDKHAIFSVLDNDHSGSINLHELKDKLNSFKPNQLSKVEFSPYSDLGKSPRETDDRNQALTSRIDGSLVIGIIKGRDFGEENISVRFFIEGSPKIQKTSSSPGPSPEWRHKGRIRLQDSNTLQSSDLSLEVQNDKGLLGRSKVPWSPVLDFPNVWAGKDEFQILDDSNTCKGFITVHLMWVPKESLRKDTSGNLRIKLDSFSGFPSALIEFTIETATEFKPLKKDEEVLLKNVEINGQLPVPTLKCTIMRSDDRSIILWRNLSIEVALACQDWTRSLKVPLSAGQELSLKFFWEEFSKEYKDQVDAAVKIQAAFRGYKVRKDKIQMKNRKMTGKKVLREGKTLFVVAGFEESGQLFLELHEVSDSQDFLNVIDSIVIQGKEFSMVCQSVSVEGRKIVFSDTPVQPKGIKGIQGSQLVNDLPKRNSKLIARRVVKRNGRFYMVTLLDLDKQVRVVLGFADDPNSPMYQEISSKILPKDEKFDQSQPSQLLNFIEITPSHQINFSEAPIMKDDLPKKPKSLIMLRKVLKLSKRYVMISIYDQDSEVKIVANLADDPNHSMFETESSITTEKQEISELLSKLSLSPDLKIQI